jgi:hypothetical protein
VVDAASPARRRAEGKRYSRRTLGAVEHRGIEEQLRGPTEVIATLQDDPVPGPPAFHEVDGDGRLTRWIDKVG